MPGVNLEVLRMDNYQLDKDKDTLFRGEFEVVKELIAALPDADVSDQLVVMARAVNFPTRTSSSFRSM